MVVQRGQNCLGPRPKPDPRLQGNEENAQNGAEKNTLCQKAKTKGTNEKCFTEKLRVSNAILHKFGITFVFAEVS